ncbi:MAG: ABC transporter permease [Candidatus Bathyarchaeia archaeon]
MRMFRILALLQYDFLVFKISKWRIIDTFYIPAASLFLWGFFLTYAREFALQAAFILLIVQVFISFVYLSQSGVSVQLMDDIWSRSLREMLTSPIRISEYLIARSLFSGGRAFVSFFLLLVGAGFLFAFDLAFSALGLWLLVGGLSLVASIGLGIFICSMILRLGAEYGFLSWAAIEFFIVLSAPFYPLSIFPLPLQYVAAAMPYTWTFEVVKTFIATGVVDMELLWRAVLVSVAYVAVSFPVFQYTYQNSRAKGRLIRLWG